MKNKRLFWSGILTGVLAVLSTGCSKQVSLDSLLQEMTSREHLTLYPANDYQLRQYSSYNRASVSPGEPGWFENNDMSHFIRVEENSGRREFVLFDAAGPGAIVRWWMTFYKAQNGILRVYIDQAAQPVIQGAPDELLSGTLLCGPPLAVSLQAGAPLGEAGRDYDHNLYVPIPYSKHCKVTYECDSIVTRYDYEGTPVPQGYLWPDVFYNIGYRTYSGNANVESFSMESLGKLRQGLAETCKALLSGKIDSGSERTFEKSLAPGDSVSLHIVLSRSAISRLAVRLQASLMNQALRSTVLRISFDGHRSVWVPAGEFFGSGYSPRPHQTWMNCSDSLGNMESFWVMPFREKCDISLVNYGNQEVKISGVVGIQDYGWKTGSMYFCSSWHEHYRIAARDDGGSPFDLNFINLGGKGVYAGDQVALFNSTHHWWGEGDEKIFVDGETFPSSFGTGSEDYYGYSFAREEAFSHPFLSQPAGIGNMGSGITVNMRHRSLDAIPFRSSLNSNIELWHWAPVQMNYALTTYYYMVNPADVNREPDIQSVKRPVSLNLEDFNRAVYSAGDFKYVPKIDAHFHYLSAGGKYLEAAKSLNFKLLTPIWDGEEVSIEDQLSLAVSAYRAFPGQYAFFGTFPVDSFNEPGFAGRTIAHIQRCLKLGASGIKIWKNIGMTLRDHAGNYVMIDDPAFEPVFRYLEDHRIPVIAHLGEPKNCWLPLEKMNNPGDASYYRNNPQYHMYLHPEVPSYEAQILARDRILKKFPNLRFVGAHLGSLEWNIDELAKRFDSYPGFMADCAARIFHLQQQSGQNYEKVRDFMIRYQDRLIYGTDSEVHETPGKSVEETCSNLEEGWYREWLYFATDSVVNDIRGLKLPAGVIDKLYYRNAAPFFGKK
jgi:predicted TIM-barrel fold metal-dependent hydrolase